MSETLYSELLSGSITAASEITDPGLTEAENGLVNERVDW